MDAIGIWIWHLRGYRVYLKGSNSFVRAKGNERYLDDLEIEIKEMGYERVV